MKDEQPSSKRMGRSLDERFGSDPVMRERLHRIADMRDELIAQGLSMDEVEERTLEQIRLLSQELIGGIGQQKSNQAAAKALQDRGAIRDRKKNSLVHDLWPHRGDRAACEDRPTRPLGASFLYAKWGSSPRLFQTAPAGLDGLWG